MPRTVSRGQGGGGALVGVVEGGEGGAGATVSSADLGHQGGAVTRACAEAPPSPRSGESPSTYVPVSRYPQGGPQRVR